MPEVAGTLWLPSSVERAPIAKSEPSEPREFGTQASHALYKAQSQRIDPFTEVGTTGLRQFGGYVLEEWLAQLAGRKAAWFYREMMDNDPVIGAILFAIRMLARTVDWPVKEGKGPNAAEAADLVESCMQDMDHSWGDLISEVLSFLPYGWALHEGVYKLRQGPQADPDWNVTSDGAYTEEVPYKASSEFSDGKVGWRGFPIRAQETLLRWGFLGYSMPVYMEQIDWHGGDHKIPLSKSLLFRTQKTRNNPEGRSLLRNSVVSYWTLKNIKQIEAIGVERDLAGIPVATPPEGVDLFAPGQATLLAKVQKMVTAIRRDEYEGIVLPTNGWELTLLNTGGSRQFDTDKVVRRYRQDIALSMLADFVLIGQDAVGSYAMVDVKSDLFGVALDGILDLIAEQFNKFAIPRLLRLNGMDASDPPTITHGSASKLDLERVGGFLQAISLAGAPIPWSKELLRSLFTEAGLPVQFDDYEPAENLPGQEENLNVQNALQSERASAEQDRARGSAQKAMLTKAQEHSGAMVALYPHKDLAHELAQPDGEEPGELHITLAYLGDAENVTRPNDLRDIVANWAASTPPLTGEISGAGRFTAGPEPVAYATPDLPELARHRERLVGHLKAEGFPVSQDHGFTPHITLAYGGERHGELPRVHNHPLRLDRVTLKLGTTRHDFLLEGDAAPLAESRSAKPASPAPSTEPSST